MVTDGHWLFGSTGQADLDKGVYMSEDGISTGLSSELVEENGEENALRAIEETIQLATLPELAPKHLPTLGAVYGRGALGLLKSFGGNSLAENMDRVDKAIANTRELSNVYNRNHTEWTRRHINMEYYDPWMNMRQISAEMSSRRQALDEAKYRQLENEVEIRREQRKLDRLLAKQAEMLKDGVVLGDTEEQYEDIDLDIMEVQISISRKQEGMMNGMSYIEGAMKEVLILEDLYEQLKDQISDFSEVEWEANNARAHLRMAISQSLRDVRERGGISKGEQRLLEQIGVNPGVLERELQEFVARFEKGHDGSGNVAPLPDMDMSVNTLREFIEQTAEKLIPVANMKSEMFGFNSKPRTDYMYTDKIATLPNKEDSEPES